MVEGLFTAIEDRFPILRRHKKVSLGITCLFFFLLSIPMVTKVMMDNYLINQKFIDQLSLTEWSSLADYSGRLRRLGLRFIVCGILGSRGDSSWNR